MNKNAMLDELFTKWQSEKKIVEHFYQDGIINEDEYDKQKIKLLFIAKEPNAKNHENQKVKCFRKEWSKTEPKYTFARRIAQWANGILNNFPDYDHVAENINYLQRIAFMNLCKIGSIGITNQAKLLKNVKENFDFLNEQIKIIQPTVIILCTGMDAAINKLLLHDVEWERTGHGINVGQRGTITIIDFYHPSARNAAAASYALLKTVFTSHPILKAKLSELRGQMPRG